MRSDRLTHAELVTIAERYAREDRRAVTVLAEPKVPGVVEIPDVIFWSRWMESTIIEIKCSLNDLRADAAKPFRHDRSGMGLHRFFMWEIGGEIRAEHVDDETGFGGLEYNPRTGQTKIAKLCHISPLARNWVNEMAVLNHYLTLATRSAGKSAQECRKSAPAIPKNKHEDIREYVKPFSTFGVAAKAIARDVLNNPKLGKKLADAIKRGEIEGLKAEGTPAVVTLAA